MTFLIQRLNDNMPLPTPPGAGQTTIRVVVVQEGINAKYQSTLIARTEQENPVNPMKGIKRAKFDFGNFIAAEEDSQHAHFIQAIGFSVFAAMNVEPDQPEEPNLIIT